MEPTFEQTVETGCNCGVGMYLKKSSLVAIWPNFDSDYGGVIVYKSRQGKAQGMMYGFW